MVAIVTQTQLHDLRPGDRVKYHGVDWKVEDYSIYQDPQGYLTDEWLLTSNKGSEYYLLREFDPTNKPQSITWYLANPLQSPRLLLPDSEENIVPRLWEDMQSQAEPYPELQLFYKRYYFESRTEGDYQTEGEIKSRITWDYWDEEHQINLAIEAFPYHQLDIYSTKVVRPDEFSSIQKLADANQIDVVDLIIKGVQVLFASVLLLVGICMMIFG
ncbi:DUF4178 domain-containing protein [Tolypothrix sp. PCC 7910]|uniref:DUF4178 domain-containing protein n=1 Tax=Tolypothrix sp. PCC 7910 TaxID=2099387 RepID=UPI0014277A13|nr:DUF4178 domain-containing protein [Tolypothrix sp. PCC 7910]QIR37525.1 DUF4178 domain-containing protein [Tolypothrix sp. PCC 7910]